MRPRRWISLLILLGLAWSPVLEDRASATSGFGPALPLFPRLFPHPTGRNGAEEIIQAVDLLDSSPVHSRVRFLGDNPLSADPAECADLLREPRVAASLALIDAGLAKPRRFPDSSLRSLGHLLTVRQIHLFNQGDNRNAFDQTRWLYRLAGEMPPDALGGAHFARALRAAAALGLAPQVGHLTPAQCREVLRHVRARPDWRPEALGVLPGEHLGARARFQDFTEALTEGRTAASAQTPLPPEIHPDEEEIYVVYRAVVAAAGGARRASTLIPRAHRAIDRAYTGWARQISRRSVPFHVALRGPHFHPEREADRLASGLLDGMTGLLPHVLWQLAWHETHERFLACAATLQLYAEQHRLLPDDLRALNLGDLGISPFTGLPFEYEVDGDLVTLRTPDETHEEADSSPLEITIRCHVPEAGTP
jgi:hypothetical protein